MDLWQSAVVGLIQGLTEFLPVSSSAHIVFAERILGIGEAGLDLAIVVHVGTLVAVFAALWYRIHPVTVGTLAGLGQLVRGHSAWSRADFRWGVYALAGTLPAALLGGLFEDTFEEAFNSPALASGMLLVTGTLLFATRFLRDATRDLTWGNVAAVGLAQAVAILPGISRSGSTISVALFCKIERRAAAEFSFLLSIPVILGGAFVHAFDMASRENAQIPLWPLLVGFAVSAVTGYLAIKLLLRFIQRGRFSWFAYYCWAVGAIGLLHFASEAHAMGPQSSDSLRVMTFNVRYPSPKDTGNLWLDRRNIAVEMIRGKNPDAIGLQEAYRIQLQFFTTSLPEYAVVGRERYGETDEEHCAILVRRGRFMVEASGTYWLSETCEIAGSRTWWPTDHPRVVTWVILNDLATARKIRILNTHFPLSGEDPARSVRCARLVRERLATGASSPEVPTILMGDFNCLPGSEAYRVLVDDGPSGFRDVWHSVPGPTGPTGTVHGFTGRPRREGARIDWILVKGPIAATGIETMTFSLDGKYPSDHFPVAADLLLLDEDREGR